MPTISAHHAENNLGDAEKSSIFTAKTAEIKMYIHQRDNWPHFTWDDSTLTTLLSGVRHDQGRLLGQMEALGFNLQQEATLATLTQDILKTSEIEGEKLDSHQVRSSIARRMGLDIAAVPKVERSVEGIVEVMMDATRGYRGPLNEERLFGWHAALFPTGRNGMQRITVGNWRGDANGPMQVVSGSYGRERVHFEAPSHDRLKTEMTRFLAWLNTTPEIDLVLMSALAHFWFVTIHPFDDGNGRIARAIADMILARSENSSQRFYSMSAQIQHERNDYYHILESCQRGDLNITAWIIWYLNCLKRAICSSSELLGLVLKKAAFWKRHGSETFNERQRSIINQLFDGFEGKLTSSKWAKLAKCSQDTANRDITDLIGQQVLVKDKAGGRSTTYSLRDSPEPETA
jgi:Fic family protein